MKIDMEHLKDNKIDRKKKYTTHDELMIPSLRALRELGGSGSIKEINEKVFEIANIRRKF